MGGSSAPDDLEAGATTQVWLATSNDPLATSSGRYFYHQQLRDPDARVGDGAIQDRLIDECARLSGIALAAG